MPKNVLNLELSSGAFSAAAFDGVGARELSPELRADAGAEADWAFSGARSAMAAWRVCVCAVVKMSGLGRGQRPALCCGEESGRGWGFGVEAVRFCNVPSASARAEELTDVAQPIALNLAAAG